MAVEAVVAALEDAEVVVVAVVVDSQVLTLPQWAEDVAGEGAEFS